MEFTPIHAIALYLLALTLIPLSVIAYGMTYAIQAKESDSMLRESHKMMRFCVKMAAPYFAVTTLALFYCLLFVCR